MDQPAQEPAIQPAGRRRNPEVRRRIIAATVAMLEEGGYRALTIEGVAARAGVGKQTIYRWWPSKASLVMESFIAAGEERVPEPDTGSVRDDLAAILVPVFAQNADVHGGTAMANKGMMAEAQLDPTFHAVYAGLHAAWWGPLHHVLERGIARGDLRPNTDPQTVIDLLLGASWYRVLLEHAPLDAAFAHRLIAIVLDGLGTDPPPG